MEYRYSQYLQHKLRGIRQNHAYNKLRGKEYDINFAFNKNNTNKLNCSALVWFAYDHVNIDLDKNGGPGVYPWILEIHHTLKHIELNKR